MSPSTGRSKGSKERSQVKRRKGTGMTVQTGPCLLAICLHPAPFAHQEALLSLCGRISLMCEAVASLITSATRKENYRRWLRHFRCCHSHSPFHVLRAGWHNVSSSTQAKFELVTSEASYIRSLTIAVDHFMLSQDLAECLGVQDKQWLFSKLPEVKDVSERWSNTSTTCPNISLVYILTFQFLCLLLWVNSVLNGCL